MINLNEETIQKAHDKIERLIEGKYYKQVELADMFGISYRTLWGRRKDKNWTGKEVEIILNEL